VIQVIEKHSIRATIFTKKELPGTMMVQVHDEYRNPLERRGDIIWCFV